MPDFVAVRKAVHRALKEGAALGPLEEALGLEDVGPAADCVAVGIVLREFVGWEVAVDLDRAEGLDGVGGVADFVAVGLLGVGGFVAASWHCPSGFSFKYYEITQTHHHHISLCSLYCTYESTTSFFLCLSKVTQGFAVLSANSLLLELSSLLFSQSMLILYRS